MSVCDTQLLFFVVHYSKYNFTAEVRMLFRQKLSESFRCIVFIASMLIVEHKCQHHCFITEVCLFHFLLSQNLQLHLWCFSWLQCLHVICFSLWFWVLRSKSFKLSAITIQLISSIPTSNCVSAVWTISRAETKLCFHLILPNCIKNTSHKRSSWMVLMRYQEK